MIYFRVNPLKFRIKWFFIDLELCSSKCMSVAHISAFRRNNTSTTYTGNHGNNYWQYSLLEEII